jgi:hypothetical protein
MGRACSTSGARSIHRFDFQPLSGGAPRAIVPCVATTHWSIQPQGIYYVPCPANVGVTRDLPLRVLNPATGEDRPFATLKDIPFRPSGPGAVGLVVSPDGRTILYSQLVSTGADLMLIENFR